MVVFLRELLAEKTNNQHPAHHYRCTEKAFANLSLLKQQGSKEDAEQYTRSLNREHIGGLYQGNGICVAENHCGKHHTRCNAWQRFFEKIGWLSPWNYGIKGNY